MTRKRRSAWAERRKRAAEERVPLRQLLKISFGAVCVTALFLLFIFAISDGEHAILALQTRGVATWASVIETWKSSGGRHGGPTYYAKVAFTDRTGRAVTETVFVDRDDAADVIAPCVGRLLYDPQDISNARLDLNGHLEKAQPRRDAFEAELALSGFILFVWLATGMLWSSHIRQSLRDRAIRKAAATGRRDR